MRQWNRCPPPPWTTDVNPLTRCAIFWSNNRSSEVEYVDDAMALKTFSWLFK